MILSQANNDDILQYLISKKLINKNIENIDTEVAGQGNMNYVLRIKTHGVILKQSSAFVQKYPQIQAPIDRIKTENAYYEAIKSNETLTGFSPKIMRFDVKNHIIAMEDLGQSNDFMAIYETGQINAKVGENLMKYLSQLHSIKNIKFVANHEMKKLNHEHIFNFPFDKNNGMNYDNIQPGLQALANKFQELRLHILRITEMGLLYMTGENTLIHGDFYPGSWLNTNDGIKVIDPEFAHKGHAEFDLGVMCAHLKMAGIHDFDNIIQHYSLNYHRKTMEKYMGIEILRRIIGIAQLPLKINLETKIELCEEAEKLITQ